MYTGMLLGVAPAKIEVKTSTTGLGTWDSVWERWQRCFTKLQQGAANLSHRFVIWNIEGIMKTSAIISKARIGIGSCSVGIVTPATMLLIRGGVFQVADVALPQEMSWMSIANASVTMPFARSLELAATTTATTFCTTYMQTA